MNRDASAITLTVPATQAMMLVVRLTTSGVLARAGLSLDTIDDVKMAAEEACNCLVRSSGCARLQVTYGLEPQEFCMRAEALACASCPDSLTRIDLDELSVIHCVLKSMVDDVDLSYEGGALRAIVLRKKLPARG